MLNVEMDDGWNSDEEEEEEKKEEKSPEEEMKERVKEKIRALKRKTAVSAVRGGKG